jgi:hypothetical protein
MENIFTVAALDGDRDCARFTEEGMEGVVRKNPNRPVSLMSLASRQGVDQAELRGLCYARFTADITLDCAQMPDKGTIIGNDTLQLGILPEGKQCWPECTLFQDQLPCPLIDGVRYAWVEAPGTLCRGDHLRVIEIRRVNSSEVRD